MRNINNPRNEYRFMKFNMSKLICAMYPTFLVFIFMMGSFGVSWGQSAGEIGFVPCSEKTITICENTNTYPTIMSCDNPSCSMGTLDYCWYVLKPGATDFVAVAGTNGSDTYLTVVGDYNGTPTTGVYKFRRYFKCMGNCPTTISDPWMDCSDEVMVTVNPLPTINLGDNPAVCQGVTSANLTYTATTGSPNQYTIDFNNAAEMQGFADVDYTELPASPIIITVPASAAPDIYNATLRVRNSTTGCESSVYNIKVTVNQLPTITLGDNPAVCRGVTSANLTYTATTGSPNQYTIDFNNAAEMQGFVDVSNTTTLPASPIIITVPASAAPDIYNATLRVRNSTTGCESSVYNITVTVNQLPIASITGVSEICQGSSTTYMASGLGGASPYTYSWTGGSTAASITVSSSDNYTVTITDTKGCTGTSSKQLTVNSNPTASITGVSEICQGSSTIYVASGSGGAIPYTYSWTGGSTNDSLTVNTSGNYTVTITDTKGCKGTSSKQLTVNSNPTASITGVSEICQGSSTIYVSSGSGGAIPYTYSWTGGSTNDSLTVNTSGNYTVTITDTKGCKGTSSKQLTVNSNPTASITGVSEICQGFSTIYVASGSGGAIPYTYSWTGGSTNDSLTVNTSGNYTITITDAKGCKGSISKQLTVNQLPIASITGVGEICQGSSTIYVASGSGGAIPYTYSWTGGSTAASITVSASGNYTVTITDTKGCKGTSSKQLIVNQLPIASITGVSEICQGSSTIYVASGSGGAIPYTYSWTGGSTAASITVSASGNYTVTITDTKGCKGTSSKQLIVHLLPTPMISGPSSICEGDNVSLTASGGALYVWSNSATTANLPLSGLADGNYAYSVTVTDQNNCTSITNTNLEVKNVPDFDLTYVSDQTTEGQINFNPIIIGGNPSEVSYISYRTIRLSDGKIIYSDVLTSVSGFSNLLEAGTRYRTEVEVYLKNECLIRKNVEYTVNSVDCSLYTIKIKINGTENIISGSLGEIKICEKDLTSLELIFQRAGMSGVEVNFNNSTYVQNGANTITVKPTVPAIELGANVFSGNVRYIFPGSEPLQCFFTFTILSQPKPKLVFDKTDFCFLPPELKIPFTKVPDNTTFKAEGIVVSEIAFPIGPRYSNDTKSYSIKLSEIRAEGNVCTPYGEDVTYNIYRTPEVNILDYLCNNDSARSLLTIDPRDGNAIWEISKGGTPISNPLMISGMDFGETGKISVVGSINYPGGLVCSSEPTIKNIERRPLPFADIGQYSEDCGPFYKARQLKDPANTGASVTWKLGNSSQGIETIDAVNQIVAVTNTGNLTLTLNKDGCYHHDTVKISNTYSLDNVAEIEGKLCGDSTLFYLQKFSGNECFRWYYIDAAGDVQEVSEQSYPYFKSLKNNKPLLVRFNCGSGCGGTIVSGRSSGDVHDCGEDQDIKSQAVWALRPVPAYDYLNLYCEKMEKGHYTITVSDVLGRTMISSSHDHTGGELIYRMDVSQLPAGYYLVGFNNQIKKAIIVK